MPEGDIKRLSCNWPTKRLEDQAVLIDKDTGAS